MSYYNICKKQTLNIAAVSGCAVTVFDTLNPKDPFPEIGGHKTSNFNKEKKNLDFSNF